MSEFFIFFVYFPKTKNQSDKTQQNPHKSRQLFKLI